MKISFAKTDSYLGKIWYAYRIMNTKDRSRKGTKFWQKLMLKRSNWQCISNLWVKRILLRYGIRIKTSLKLLSSCPYSPDSIMVSKSIFGLMRCWNWSFSILGSEIIHDLVEKKSYVYSTYDSSATPNQAPPRFSHAVFLSRLLLW